MSIQLIVLFFSIPFVSCSQQREEFPIAIGDSGAVVSAITPFNNPSYEKFHNTWIELEKGMWYIEKDGPRKDKVGDSKISILKIEPKHFDFEFLSATQVDSSALCVVDWAEKHHLISAINAGMYDLRRPLMSKGMLQNNAEYANNPALYEGYNMVIACNPFDKSLPSFDIIDLKCTDISVVKRQYASIAQGLRMIDCSGNPMSWNKNPQWCSQLIVAKDKHGFIYFVFTRTPYSHNEMIYYMVHFEEPLLNAIYMEGGPQTSLFVNTKNDRIEKLGSFVSKTYPTDKNAEFWQLPNIIGVRKK